MTWNHRVMKSLSGGEEIFTIREVYYSENGKLSWTENEMAPFGESPEELREDLERMLAACDKPVLDEAEEEKKL